MSAMRPFAALLLSLIQAPAAWGFEDAYVVYLALHAASAVVNGGCSGALIQDRDLVVTARHCVRQSDTADVEFTNGDIRSGSVVAVDRAADQALLLLDEPVPIEPLLLAEQAPEPRSRLYFEGNPERPQFQEAELDRFGRCPSLPDLPNALFTTIEGQPGDSGAALVDRAARVVGLVHGGERCHIATPADALWRLLHRVFEWETSATELASLAPRGGATHGRRATLPAYAALTLSVRGRTPVRSAGT
jgi:hypothetical protein